MGKPLFKGEVLVNNIVNLLTKNNEIQIFSFCFLLQRLYQAAVQPIIYRIMITTKRWISANTKHFPGFPILIMIILPITTRLFSIIPSIIFRMNWRQGV